ncbi:MAG: glycerophosphodiester phosphodiesterase family protein [Candidatus Thorarchaeota archaeon]
MKKQFVVAHRGGSELAPENTLPAFQLAYEIGSHMVETDVHEAKDGTLVCIHDYDVDRTTNGTGAIADLTYREIRDLDAGNGAKIPTLAEVLDFVRGKMNFNIELKVTEIEKEVLAAVKERDMISDVTISSFLHGTLISMKNLEASISTAVLTTKVPDQIISYVIEHEANALNPDYKNIRSEIIAEAHSNNIQVFPWTVNDSKNMQTLYEMGVDGIITDCPDVALEIVKKLHD